MPFRLSPAFFEHVRLNLMGGRLPQDFVDGCNVLAEAFSGTVDEMAYVLATAYHETAHTMQPIVERGNRAYFQKYEERESLGNTKAGDGYRYRGRGFVQITGRRNYSLYGIADKPDAALEPETAARIACDGMIGGKFTGKALRDYFGASKCDPIGARKIINGTDRAKLIAGYWAVFKEALEEADDGQEDHPITTGKPAAQSTTVLAAGAAGVASTVNAVNEAIRPVQDAIDAGKGLQETVSGLVSTPAVLIGCIVIAAAIWIIRERLRHARVNGV